MKRLDITPKIAAAIALATDNSVDVATLAVYEWIAVNTLPVSKKGTLFEGARITEGTLRQMADYLNAGKFVPLHTLHNQGNELPVGRVFSGKAMVSDVGVTELRVLFYLPLSETELLGKIDSGVIQEVSVGVKSKHLNCSECGFDYLGEDATFEHLWGRTCPEGHQIGVNGVHTTLSELERFMELSLVSLGAANNAKSISRAKSLLSAAEYNQALAASGVNPEITHLFASPSKPPVNKEPSMDLTVLVADLTTAKATNQTLEGKLAASQSQIDTLAASETALKAEVVTLKAAADVKLPEVQAELTTTKTSLDAALAFVRGESDRLAIAAGLEKQPEAATLDALVASISNAKTKLAGSIPVNGAANPTLAATGDVRPLAPNNFKIK